MRVYERDKRWYVDFSYNGKRYRKAAGRTKRDALLKLGKIVERFKEEETQGTSAHAPRTFFEYAQEYLAFSKVEKAPSNFQRESYKTRSLLKVFGGIELKDITPVYIEQYKQALSAKSKPATVNRQLALLKHMLTKAVDWGYLKENPSRSVKLLKEPPGRIRFLSLEERRLLLDECEGILKDIVLTALETGMRNGEIQNLFWSDVDLERRTITVIRTKNNESRILPISNRLLPSLEQLYIQRQGIRVFSKQDGTPYGNWRKAYEQALKRTGIKDFRFHDLRHTFASYLVMAGVDIRTVQVLMGHKTIQMTMRYSHLSQSHLLDAVNRVGTNVAHFEASVHDNLTNDVVSRRVVSSVGRAPDF